jgi:surface antigen Omp85-like protein
MHDVQTIGSRGVVAALLVLLAAPVMAQDPQPASTRANILDDARQALTSQSAPPTRSKVETGLYWYDNQYVLTKVLSGWKGIHLAGGDFPAGAGIKFGVGYDRALTSHDPDPALPNRVAVNARAAYSTMGYARLRAGVNASNLGGVPVDVSGFSQYYEFPQEDFFGFGMHSQESDRTNYLLDAYESGGSVRWRPFFLDLSAGGSYISPGIGHGTDNRFPSTEERFDPATVPGLGTQTDFVKVEASAAIDWRDNPAHPHAGGRYGVTAAKFDDRDLNQFDFHRIDVNLQQYVPLTDRYRILALRADAVFTDGDHGHAVPFYFQPTLGGAKQLRGYREFRFLDQNSLLLGAEYRWEAWWALDGALFVDAGTVAARRQDLSLGDMNVSYGIGFRFHSNNAVVARLDLAFSREGFVPLLRFEHVF